MARFLQLMGTDDEISVESVWVNGTLAIAVEHRGVLHAVTTVQIEAGRVVALHGINNPAKLTRLHCPTALTIGAGSGDGDRQEP